jgi:hypothetical protein
VSIHWSRINTVLLLVIGIGIAGLLATRAYGGPLDPPGPPGSTDGVRRPGTPISSLPFTISQPGYYYVTRPITAAASQDGITVLTSNVTIDLNGFTLTGGSTPGDGITIAGFRNVVIQNGAVRAWDIGIDALGCGNCRIERVQASSNQNLGIKAGQNSTVQDCNVSLNILAAMIVQQATVRNCTFSENGGPVTVHSNSLIEGNRFSVNTTGVLFDETSSTLRGNEFSGNGIDILITDSSVGAVLIENVYCNGTDNSASTIYSANINRDTC